MGDGKDTARLWRASGVNSMRYLVIKRHPGADLWFETNDYDRALQWADENDTDEIYDQKVRMSEFYIQLLLKHGIPPQTTLEQSDYEEDPTEWRRRAVNNFVAAIAWRQEVTESLRELGGGLETLSDFKRWLNEQGHGDG